MLVWNLIKLNSFEELSRILSFISSEDQIKFYFDLTQTGFKLFFLIMGIYQKQIGGDEIYLNFETAKEEAEKYDYTISKAVYYRGLKELLEKKMIAKSVKKYIFYINPAIVFNGDRARFVKEIRIKEEEKQREADLKSINERLDRYA